eukprot:gene46191-56556_t
MDFQSGSSSCGLDALAVLCKRVTATSSISSTESDEDDIELTFQSIMAGEATRNDLEHVSSLGVLWRALVRVAASIPLPPTSNSMPDFSALGNDEARFLAGFLSACEVLIEFRGEDVADILQSLCNVFFGNNVGGQRTNELIVFTESIQTLSLQLLREYKDIFPFAYTFNRRIQRSPKPAYNQVEKYFRGLAQSNNNNNSNPPTTDSSNSLNPSLSQSSLYEEDNMTVDTNEDSLSSSFHLDTPYPSLPAPSLPPPLPPSYPDTFSPHQADIVRSYYNALEEDEDDSDDPIPAPAATRGGGRGAGGRKTRMKARGGGGGGEARSSAKVPVLPRASVSKSVTFNVERNKV